MTILRLIAASVRQKKEKGQKKLRFGIALGRCDFTFIYEGLHATSVAAIGLAGAGLAIFRKHIPILLGWAN